MAWNPQHKQRSRERIITSAARLFALHGFEQVSIDTIMSDAGMTRGAFYAHFHSKSELYGEAILSAASYARQQVHDTDETERLTLLSENYLSKRHLQGNGLHCPLAFLISDITQRETAVRDTYTKVFKGLVDLVREPEMTSSEARQRALQRAVLMIGGVAVARAINDESLALELLEACRDSVQSSSVPDDAPPVTPE